MIIDWPVSLCGFLVGCLVGMTGMGGGAVMTGLLIAVFGMHPVTAVGTDLVFASVTKIGGTLVHARNGNVDWRVVRRLAAGSLPGALLALAGLAYIEGINQWLGRLLGPAIGLTLVVSAAMMLRRGRLKAARSEAVQQWTEPRWHGLRTALLGLVIGFLVTLTSVGAGALALAMLIFLYPGYKAVRLVGSDIAHAVPLTLVAGLGHGLIGNVDWALLAAMLLGSLPGIAIGSHYAHKVPDRILVPALSALLLVIGGRLILA
jgi:uncharacterized membrane protein YfcA